MCLRAKSLQSCPILCDPMDCSPPGSSVHGISQARIMEWVVISFSRVSSHPGIKPRSLTLQVDSLQAEPPGKSKNKGVGSLSHLQGILPTQESNQGLLHCRWILYQLSYEGRPGNPNLSRSFLKVHLKIRMTITCFTVFFNTVMSRKN